VALTSTLPVFEPVTNRENHTGGGGDAVLQQVKDSVAAHWKMRQFKDSASANLSGGSWLGEAVL